MTNDELGFMITNFRDFGGYKTQNRQSIKKGLFFRSAHLDRLKGDALQEFNRFGVKTVIDLRSLKEKKSKPTFLEGANRISLPVDYDEKVKAEVKPIVHKKDVAETIKTIVTTAYSELVTEQKGEVKAVFDILTQKQSYPVLIHCRAGKDRTGFICAVIQLALGVSEEDVIRDYLLSNKYYLPHAQKIMRRIKLFTLGLFRASNFEFILINRERYIKSALNTIKDRYGSVESYLSACGIDSTMLNRVRELTLE